VHHHHHHQLGLQFHQILEINLQKLIIECHLNLSK